MEWKMEVVILFTMTDYHITSGWESLRLYLWLPMCQTASACGLTSLVGIVLNCTVFINWCDTSHFKSKDDYCNLLSKHQSLLTTVQDYMYACLPWCLYSTYNELTLYEITPGYQPFTILRETIQNEIEWFCMYFSSLMRFTVLFVCMCVFCSCCCCCLILHTHFFVC